VKRDQQFMRTHHVFQSGEIHLTATPGTLWRFLDHQVTP
jgi:hypothetical protein